MFSAAFFLVVFLVTLLFFVIRQVPKNPKMGLTFSESYAEYLGLDYQQVYQAILSDLSPDMIRLPVYWGQVQPLPDQWDWSKTDWLVEESSRANIPLTLAVGLKVPRWPECYLPDWLVGASDSAQFDARMKFIEQTVERYKTSPVLKRWQIENEPFFPFGQCVFQTTLSQLDEEIALVRRLDPSHPIVLTVSGEGEPWFPLARRADILGVSLYRVTGSALFGYIPFPFSALGYRLFMGINRLWVPNLLISELQAEPWFLEEDAPKDIETVSTLFTADDLRDHVVFAKRTGVSEMHLWGVEWWYFLREHGKDGLWKTAQELFSS